MINKSILKLLSKSHISETKQDYFSLMTAVLFVPLVTLSVKEVNQLLCERNLYFEV